MTSNRPSKIHECFYYFNRLFTTKNTTLMINRMKFMWLHGAIQCIRVTWTIFAVQPNCPPDRDGTRMCTSAWMIGSGWRVCWSMRATFSFFSFFFMKNYCTLVDRFRFSVHCHTVRVVLDTQEACALCTAAASRLFKTDARPKVTHKGGHDHSVARGILSRS